MDKNDDPLHASTRPLDSAGDSPSQSDVPTIDPALERPDVTARDEPISETHFGVYELLEKLGEGGMGLVYKACHTKLKRMVALKMILTGQRARKADLDRFRIEAEAVARLQHPGIVQIYEIGEHDSQPFLALEYCDGGTLADQLRGKSLPPKDAAKLVKQLAEAVQAAHQQRVIHRDLKPANVLLSVVSSQLSDVERASSLTTDNRQLTTPKITDFGLAKKLDDSEGLTQQNAIMGTPSYMAPEQARGSNEIGPAADVYALGAILYECLTGRPPFKAATPLDTIKQVINDEPVPPRRVSDNVPRDLETICLKCLEKDVHRRYASAQDLADELGRFLDGEPIQARSVGRAERVWRWCKRHPAVAAWAAIAIAVLIAGTIVSTWFAIQSSWNEAQAVQNAKQKDELAATALQLAKQKDDALTETRWHLYVAKLRPMMEAASNRDFGRVEHLLEESIPKNDEPDFRGWEWYYLKNRCQQASRILKSDAPYNGVADWCRKTGKIAAATLYKSIHIWSQDGEKIERRIPTTGMVHDLKWSPDGSQLAYTFQHHLAVWNLTHRKQVFESLSRDVETIAWSPDGRKLASAGKKRPINIWDVQTEKLERSIQPEFEGSEDGYTAAVINVAWHPDGERLAASFFHGHTAVWNVKNGELLFVRKQSKYAHNNNGYAAWSLDGKLAARDGTSVRIYDDSGNQLSEIPGFGVRVRSMHWSVDGRFLLTGGDDQSVRICDPIKGEVLRTLRLHRSPIRSVAWNPQGDRVLSGAEDLRIIKLEGNTSAARVYKVSDAPLFDVSWRHDGKQLACSGNGKFVCICDPANGQVIHRLMGHSPSAPHEGIESVVWSPDGNHVASIAWGGKMILWDAGNGKAVRRLTPDMQEMDGNWDLVWHPKRQTMAAVHGRRIYLWNTATWQHSALNSEKGQAKFLSWSPDGRYLAAGHYKNVLSVWDVERRCLLFRKTKMLVTRGLVWSRDGRLLAVGRAKGIMSILHAEDGETVLQLQGHHANVSGIQWSPNQRRIATSSHDGTVKIWDAATGTALMTLSCDGALVWSVRWSPDGRRLACTCEDGTVRVWEAAETESADLAHLKNGLLVSAQKSRTPRQIAEYILRSGGTLDIRGKTVQDPADLLSNMDGRLDVNLSGCENVRDLNLSLLARFKNLRRIDLRKTTVDDNDVHRIARLKTLKECNLQNTRFTTLGIDRLRKELPNTEVLWNTYDDDRKAALWALKAGGNLHIREPARRYVAKVAQLPEHPFRVVELRIPNVKDVGDREIARVAKLDAVEKLDLAGTGVTDVGLKHLSTLHNLNWLRIDSTTVTGKGMQHLSDMQKLQFLSCKWGNPLGDEGIAQLPPLRNLTTLVLTRMMLTDECLQHLVKFKNIEELHIGHRSRFGGKLQSLTKLPKLRLLNLRFSRIQPEGFIAIGKIASLQSLDLTGNQQITDSDLTNLTSLKNLSQLFLDECRISDDGLRHLYGLKNLTKLQLKTTYVTAQGKAALREKLPGCTVDFETIPDPKTELEKLTKAIEANPKKSGGWQKRGLYLRTLQKWAKAAKDFDEAVSRAPGSVYARCMAAHTHLITGNITAYRRHCTQILKRVGTQPESVFAKRFAVWVCCLAPDDTTDYSLLLRMAESAARDGPDDWRVVRPQCIVLYRMKRYDEALKVIDKCEALNDSPYARAVHHLWKSICEHRLGNGDEAKRLLKTATDIIDNELPGSNEILRGWEMEHVECHVIRREAEALIPK